MDASKIDVDALFKQYTIKEIQAIELQIKNEIEKKKEDLRIMVYNRYRDIIEAADGIHVMKKCSKQIESVLSDLQSTSENLFNDKENSIFANQERFPYSTILQNSPSKIWYHLDNDEYLKAAKQYLIAQHVHVCLELEKSLKTDENSASYIQYAYELWNSTVFLSNTIVNKARNKLLNSVNIQSSKILIDSICCIYLLENTNLKQLFQEYISTRTELIGKLLDSEEFDPETNLKDRILDCLKSLVVTVNCFYDVFSSDIENKSEDFEALINDNTFTIEALKDDGVVISKIPNYVKSVKFKDTEHIKKFDADYLRLNCSQWLQTCLEELKSKLKNVFKYATNLKSLVIIRDSVLEFESNLINKPNLYLSNQQSWSSLCQNLFNQNIEFWNNLISPFYYAQSKLIIETSFKSTHESLIQNLKEILNDQTFQASNDQKFSPETDINSFLWSFDAFNSLNDFSKNRSQVDFFSSHNLKLTRQSSNKNLSIGEKHLYSSTPAIQKLCRGLEDDLNKLLNDIELSTSGSYTIANESNITILTNDFKCFNEYLQDNLDLFSENLCKSFKELITLLNTDSCIDSLNIKKILLISRLTHAMPYNCPHLKICFNNLNQQLIQQRQQVLLNSKQNLENSTSALLNALTKKKQILNENKTSNDENWVKFLNKLSDISKKGLGIWIENLCIKVKKDLNENLFNSNNGLNIDELVAWDEIEIDDEVNINQSDDFDNQAKKSDQQSFKSKLSVPLVCSSTIQNILHMISHQLTKDMSYTMIESNLVLKELVLSVFNLMLEVYLNFLSAQENSNENRIKLTQNQSLQILFDLRFMFNLFDLKSSNYSSLNADDTNEKFNKIHDDYKKVCSCLESLIDPFDYDICLPFIQSNVSKAISRTATLYGILSVNERHLRSLTSSNSTVSSANEKFNLIVLTNSQQRYELLPIASQQAQQLTTQSQSINTKYKSQTQNEDKTKRTLASKDTISTSGIFGFKWFQ
ncbi:unnamed protein product [Brachionus calyciflorus]|uniref:Conserved oligomeric Golgi complex subunit 1 n=1 Tax=Brachionus calyciflorus TaxID=104777 RepID=A0A813M6P3_9BILA|nr:unnamed protein product [Brachionus calyciflorus]